MKSLIQTEQECFFCRTTRNLNLHHCFGASNRKISTKEGFTVFLCKEHHQDGNDSVHRMPNEGYDLILKKACQSEFEQTRTREEFIKLIGQSYLGLED